MMRPVLELSRVSLVMGGMRLLDDISLSLMAGERAAVVGPSGCGKSLLVRLAAGLTAPLAGSVSLLGQALSGASIDTMRAARARCGFVLQGTSLLSNLTVEENLWLGLPGGATSRDRFQARLDRLVLDFRIDHLADSPADALSSGERRRVELARAFLRDPPLLLMDEPLDGSHHGAAELEAMLVRHIVIRRRALLLITQDRALAGRLCERIYGIESGRLVQQSPGAAYAPSGV